MSSPAGTNVPSVLGSVIVVRAHLAALVEVGVVEPVGLVRDAVEDERVVVRLMCRAARTMLPRSSPPSYVAASLRISTMYQANNQPVA